MVLPLPNTFLQKIGACYIVLKTWNIREPQQLEQVRIYFFHICIFKELFQQILKKSFCVVCAILLIWIEIQFQEQVIICPTICD